MKKTILILDDDVQLTMQWSRALAAEGYEVLVAHGSDDALQVFSNTKIDLCIVDFLIRQIGRPNADACISFLGRMDVHARKKTKILGVSGMMRDHSGGLVAKEYLTTFGIDDFLSKPFSDEKLVVNVTKLLY